MIWTWHFGGKWPDLQPWFYFLYRQKVWAEALPSMGASKLQTYRSSDLRSTLWPCVFSAQQTLETTSNSRFFVNPTLEHFATSQPIVPEPLFQRARWDPRTHPQLFVEGAPRNTRIIHGLHMCKIRHQGLLMPVDTQSEQQTALSCTKHQAQRRQEEGLRVRRFFLRPKCTM